MKGSHLRAKNRVVSHRKTREDDDKEQNSSEKINKRNRHERTREKNRRTTAHSSEKPMTAERIIRLWWRTLIAMLINLDLIMMVLPEDEAMLINERMDAVPFRTDKYKEKPN